MKNVFRSFFSLITISILAGCNPEKKDFDASGAFEAEETIISSEATGTLLHFDVEEGETLDSNQLVGIVDSVQLYLKKKQLEAQIRALLGKKPNVPVQLATLQEQLKTAESEKIRYTKLVNANAAPAKQLDDINTQIAQLKKQMEAQKSSLNLTSEGFTRETFPLQVQIQQLEEQIDKCTIRNPLKGTVLLKYTNEKEMVSIGKPLYKIADLSALHLRAYITGDQLSAIKLNQQVRVLTDDGTGGFKETTGTVVWISEKAEFTPKTIQTKDERANMVYAIKVKVQNDGTYKIGMYGEVKFN